MGFVHEGGCQCGAIRYRVDQQPVRVSICHCRECQRQSGSAFSMAMIVADAGVHVLQGALKTWTRSSESGRPVRCMFCPDCGTRLFHYAEVYAGYTNVRPGTLDDTSWLQPNISIWMRSKQPWVPVPEAFHLHDTQP